jgi:hypothetical protein
MAAPIVATIPALEVISGGEDRVATCIDVEILLSGFGIFFDDGAFNLCENRLGVVEFVCNAGHGFEAGPAEAGRLDGIGSEAIQNLAWDDDFLAPTRALIEMALGDAALIVALAKRTPFVAAEALGRQRLLLGILRFHEELYAFGVVMPRWPMYLPLRSA